MQVNKDTKLLFFDIDGTLITDDMRRILPDSVVSGIREARKNNALTFINTGRVFCNIEQSLRDIGFDGYVCGCGGYIRFNDEVLYHKKYNQDICREIAYKCRDFNLTAIFEHTDKTCYDKEMNNSRRDTIVEYFANATYKLVDDIESDGFIFDKFSGWYSKGFDVEGFKNYISPYFDYIDREGDFCEMAPKGHSKATGIKFLLDFFGLPIHNAYVFGDGNNDLEMLKFVPNSICMSGGSELAMKTASYITEPVLEDGIYKALKHFNII